MTSTVQYAEAQLSLFYPQISPTQVDPVAVSKAAGRGYLPAAQSWVNTGGPAVALSSEYGESQIVVTDNAVLLQVVFRSRERVDPTACQNYLIERVDPLRAITRSISREDQLLYAGVTIITEIKSDQSEIKLIDVMKHELSDAPRNDLIDVTLRTSCVESDSYYTNVTIENFRTFSSGTLPTPQLRVNNDHADERGIRLQIDHNSRYAHNVGHDPKVSAKDHNKMIKRSFAIARGRAKGIIELLEQKAG